MTKTNEQIAAPDIRCYRDDGGVIRPCSPVADIASELARRGMVELPGASDCLVSYSEPDGSEFAVWVTCQTCQMLISLPSLKSYVGFMRQFAVVAGVLDRILQ